MINNKAIKHTTVQPLLAWLPGDFTQMHSMFFFYPFSFLGPPH